MPKCEQALFQGRDKQHAPKDRAEKSCRIIGKKAFNENDAALNSVELSVFFVNADLAEACCLE